MFLTCPSVSQFISSGCFGGFLVSTTHRKLTHRFQVDTFQIFRLQCEDVHIIRNFSENFDPSWKLIRRSFFKVEYWDQFWNVDDRVKEQRCWIKDHSSLKFDLHRGIFIKNPILNSTANYLLQKWHIHNLIWKLNFWFLYLKIKNVK